ncbi:MAG: imidazole glycerol phosphate synthase subunit HisF, partial [Candidatus Omnitrophica bacterium]|nr:imidazole glycerol phosphate synthase subunit HisF [Candidatus Omnitrophota bacterium]
ASAYSRAGADEIVFLDITASAEHRKTMLEVVRRTAEQVFIPFTVGGGIKTIKDMEVILRKGADKISINTAAIKNPALIKAGARQFGNQCIVVAIDARRRTTASANPTDSAWEVYIYGGRTATGIDALAWARRAENLGAGEILLTSMDRDGTKAGYDLDLTRAVSRAVKIPVIASGGVGSLRHLYEGLVCGEADAVLAASVFHYGTYTIQQTKAYLRKHGVLIRQ